MKSLALCLLLALPFTAAQSADPGDSIYQLTPALTDQEGEQRALNVYRGQPVLVSMFYASCPNVCPLLISTVQRIERPLTPAQRRRLRVMMISIDPQRDTPAALKKLSRDHRTDLTRWSFMRAGASDVRQMAAVLGVQYRELPDGEFNHSSVITLLDGDGRIVAQTSVLGRDDPEFLKALQAVLHE